MPTPHEELRRLEESLWREATRFDPHYLEALLSPDFFEFGRSGRIWTRQDVLAHPAVPIDAELPLADFAVHMVDDDVALVTYRSSVRSGNQIEWGNRSSIWHRTESGWKLHFHQGTPTQGATAPDIDRGHSVR